MIDYRFQVNVVTRMDDGRELDGIEHDVPRFANALAAARRHAKAPDVVRVEIVDTMARRGRPRVWQVNAAGELQVDTIRDTNPPGFLPWRNLHPMQYAPGAFLCLTTCTGCM